MDEEVIDSVPRVGEILSPAQAMRIAIAEAAKGAGFVSPNPLVGCAIVDREHKFLAVGFHRRVGYDHAEIDALKKLPNGVSLEDCHVYVTLEPCAHQGRTPSCARTLAPLKPSSVTFAVLDPNPLVAGKGAEILKEAGVKTLLLRDREDIPVMEREELEAQAEEVAEIFLHNQRAKEPFVAIKVATSLDGKMAMLTGESKWITGEKSREHVHLLRARYDAVLVGRNTFVADDPSLNVRHASYPGFENKAVLFDPQGKTLDALAGSNLLKVRKPDNVIVVVGNDADPVLTNPSGVTVLRAPVDGTGLLPIPEVLTVLRSHGIHSLMIEGGSHTYAAFFNAGKVQRIHAFMAPLLLGGKHGLAWSQHFGVEAIGHGMRLSRSQRAAFGEDLYWTAKVAFHQHVSVATP